MSSILMIWGVQIISTKHVAKESIRFELCQMQQIAVIFKRQSSEDVSMK